VTLAAEFLAFDDRLGSLGVPRLSDWWRLQVRRYLDAHEAGAASEFWACAGRGGAKSTCAYKLATFAALFGRFDIPADERHYAIVLSRMRVEAEKGLEIIAGWLRKLGVPHRPVGDVIDLEGTPRGIRIVAASVAGASGWRAFHLACDEFSKWAWEGSPDHAADEVLTSAKAMCATHPNAMVMVASSPWLDKGSFYDAITAGDGDGRIVAGPAPSWVANPIVTRASTLARERNPRRWAREYNAEFSSSFEGGFFEDATVMAATDTGRDPLRESPHMQGAHIVTIDPAFAEAGDNYARCVAHSESRGRGPVVVVDHISILHRPKDGPLSSEESTRSTVRLRRAYGSGAVYSDQHSAAVLREVFMRHSCDLIVESWTLASKRDLYELTRQLMIDGRLRLPDSEPLRNEMAAIGLKLTANGNETIDSRAAHDDRVSALVHAVARAHRTSPAYGRADGKASFYDYARPRSQVYGGVSGPTSGSDGRGGAMGL
jgi:hypothetical protein